MEGSDSVGGNKVKTAGRVLVREATCPQGRVWALPLPYGPLFVCPSLR